MGFHRLLQSSCCLLNTNAKIKRQLTGTARTLEAEWWQVCGEALVRGQRKMSQVLGAFGLLYFTTLLPVLAWRAFWNLWTIYFFNFPNFFSGCSKPRITENAYTESADKWVRLYFDFCIRPVFIKAYLKAAVCGETQEKLNRSAGLKNIQQWGEGGANHNNIIFKFSSLSIQCCGRSHCVMRMLLS